MFFKKKKSHGLPLGVIIGALATVTGTVAIAASNKEVRKAIEKEWSKCCKKCYSSPGMVYFRKQMNKL